MYSLKTYKFLVNLDLGKSFHNIVESREVYFLRFPYLNNWVNQESLSERDHNFLSKKGEHFNFRKLLFFLNCAKLSRSWCQFKLNLKCLRMDNITNNVKNGQLGSQLSFISTIKIQLEMAEVWPKQPDSQSQHFLETSWWLARLPVR